MGIEAILALAGLVVPPAFQFIKGLFMPEGGDTPEATMSTLATTKPEVLAQYTEALSKHMDAQVRFFNRDIAGIPRQWVVDLRASIRPSCAAIGVLALIAEGFKLFDLPVGTRAFFIMATSTWFGSRVFNGSGK